MQARIRSISRSIVGATAFLVFMGLATKGALAQDVPFHASGSATFAGIDPPYEFLEVTGRATQLGPFQGIRSVRLYGHTIVATTTLLAGHAGDSIELYSELKWDKRFVQASGFYVITGGTGRFEAATGFGAESIGPFDPAVGARVVSWNGIIRP